MVWVLNRLNNSVTVEDALNYIDWPFISNTQTFKDIAFLCITTAIIAEHSYFLWKKKPSGSSTPFELAIQKLNSSTDLEKIKTAIEEASHLKSKDKKHALVKIALENCLSL
ncbi:uncharacterized protein LACBIDRAFT_304962 [Laccaria bicolor S238N-H82]|uniref:Predicted protein n=1 Tax=Laccaria bicolor (strain S238N-H82 / ATCC MYA-4686) TaxID=486041 RepID=B0CT18_LACBS|nr:uncharacterized protein LACBIDRAFT_304962 [Laccaria bicolor S238N-H82]EDR13862.1 predicted protein [Laccaria bicolor S238N-H82]|eukprot:XP_001874421.1 predicted protein [Laccaria bicolor S238N-H82]